jgi:uncharacterized protein (DUF2141 family)
MRRGFPPVSTARIMRFAITFPLLLLMGNAPTAELEVRLEKLRNERGSVHLCLTRNPAHFPDCGQDPDALKRSVPAANTTIHFTGILPGDYALAVLHDENRNGRLDTLIGIPREGFGFSRSPVVLLGPPRFNQVRFGIVHGFTRQTVRMQYLL